MTQKTKDLIFQALESLRSDDLNRARREFARYTPDQMTKEYGRSGKTPAQIIAEYEAHDESVNVAIAEVKAA